MKREDLPDKFCPLPFVQFATIPDGRILPCCNMGEWSYGNIKEQTMTELWNGERIQQLRQEFLDGSPKICSDQIKDRGCHLENDYLLPYVEPKVIQDKPLKKLYLQLNGKCNLECIMCDVWYQPNGNFTEENFFDDGKKHFYKNLKQVIILGGEPFVQADTFRLMDEIPAVNPNCEFGFTTNLSFNFNKGFEKKLDKINLVEINVSIDSLVEETFVSIRKKANFDLIMTSLSKLIEYRKEREKRTGHRFILRLMMTVQKLNYTECLDMYRFAQENNCEMQFIFVYVPMEHSILTFPTSERLNVAKQILGDIIQTNEYNLIKILRPVIRSLNKESRLLALAPLLRIIKGDGEYELEYNCDSENILLNGKSCNADDFWEQFTSLYSNNLKSIQLF